VTRILPESGEQDVQADAGVGTFITAPQQKAERRCPFHRKLRGEARPWLQRGSAMIATSMISFLFGAVLGQRFTVLVLIPAMIIVMILAIGAAITHPQAAWWIIAMAAAAAVCLQCGYFAGIFIRHFLAATPSQESPLAGAETSTRHAVR
jgi:hypothetical protein